MGMSEMIRDGYYDEHDTAPDSLPHSWHRTPSCSSVSVVSMSAASRSTFRAYMSLNALDRISFSCRHLLPRLHRSSILIPFQILLSNHPGSPVLASETARATKNTDAGLIDAKDGSGFKAGKQFHRHNSNSAHRKSSPRRWRPYSSAAVQFRSSVANENQTRAAV